MYLGYIWLHQWTSGEILTHFWVRSLLYNKICNFRRRRSQSFSTLVHVNFVIFSSTVFVLYVSVLCVRCPPFATMLWFLQKKKFSPTYLGHCFFISIFFNGILGVWTILRHFCLALVGSFEGEGVKIKCLTLCISIRKIISIIYNK